MRIISGKFKGKTINFLKNLNTRPLKDSVKENIFNILCHSKLINLKLNKTTILDLYSGVGSFGLECASRGAKKVTFIERNKEAFETLNKNIIKLSIIDQVEIINDQIENFLKKNKNEKFNIFFFDPPFADTHFVEYLDFIKRNKNYEKRHIVIIHREKKTIDKLEKTLKVIIEKNYGRSKIIFGVFI